MSAKLSTDLHGVQDAPSGANAAARTIEHFFDADFYLSTFSEGAAPANPIQHYLDHGWLEGRDPAPWFSTRGYLDLHQDVASAGVNPLLHYAKHGAAEGRALGSILPIGGVLGVPDFAPNTTEEVVVDGYDHVSLERGAGAAVPDQQESVDAMPPHPAPQEGDEASPASTTTADVGSDAASMDAMDQADIDAISPYFDVAFYCAGFPKDEAPADPIRHYLHEGWTQGRDPAPWFSTWHYLAMHRDVAGVGMNPFLHYCIAGQNEGRTLARLGKEPVRHKAHGDLFGQLFERTSGARSPMFAPLTTRQAEVQADDPKAIAFYLPQFHPFPENDRWWGKGFTEWTNVSKAVPQYAGHNQPRLPGELGHYDLRLPEVMTRQIELARQFGIHGFCFHYYWFSGRRLLEKPLDMFLHKKGGDFDFPFCLCWANENWTRRWDGAEHDVLMRQSHDREDHLGVINDLLRYMKDPRYIKVGNCPVIVVYRPSIIDQLSEMVEIWRRRAIEEGFDGLFLIATNSFGFNDPTSIGFDGICEFPPHNVVAGEITENLKLFNESFGGKIFDYAEARDFSLRRYDDILSQPERGRYFPGVMLGWDNEARKPGRGNIFHGADPRKFHDWLVGALKFSKQAHTDDARFVFVNAWNEWGEGTYLEPDRWFGYAYLNAVSASYTSLSNAQTTELRPVRMGASRRRKPGVIFVHAFYHDLLPDLDKVLSLPWMRDRFDVVVTVPTHWSYSQMKDALELRNAKTVLVTPNIGRDIYPFLQAYQSIDPSAYEIALKLHTKKSPHLPQGDRWRKAILQSLTGEDEVCNVIGSMQAHREVGLMAPRSLLMPCNDASALRDNVANLELLQQRYGVTIDRHSKFVAGSMFWFRPVAFQALRAIPLGPDDFGPELGAIDGTMAHAMERLLPTFVQRAGFTVDTYSSDSDYNPYV